MEQFQHEHPLNLIDLQPNYPHFEEEEYEDEDEEEINDLITKHDFQCPCNRCCQAINFYHRYYYKCSHSCDYFIHKFCAKLPSTLKHKSHNAHTLVLSQSTVVWLCDNCESQHNPEELSYNCSSCDFNIDLNCAKLGKDNRVIHHPCHSHPLVSVIHKPILCECNACGKEHKGTFYNCTTCLEFSIHNDCAFLPKKLLIQQTTNDVFHHTHPLTVTYSFPEIEQRDKFDPTCRVCDDFFFEEDLWIYKCEKCRYYAHVDCATSRKEPFMSIFLSAGRGKTFKNFKDADHPDLLHLPFLDQTYSILKYMFFKERGCKTFETHERNLKHISHQHPLILVHEQYNDITRTTSSRINLLSCHDPMKKIELLCNGCLRPIMTMPFYKCAFEDQRCNFFLHEWCTQLPVEVKNHPGQPQHTLSFLPKAHFMVFGIFLCEVCCLPSNGFLYGCVQCHYYIDVSCGFIPEKITHEAHPNHLLWRVERRPGKKYCRSCLEYFIENKLSFSYYTCDFDLHPECAFLLPKTVRHKYDKHPITLSYFPIENHKSQYFCEICEYTFDPECWFYHCSTCVQSMHSSCVPLILESKTSTNFKYYRGIFVYVNIKFGGIHNIQGHPHAFSFVQGIESDGPCVVCNTNSQYGMILICSQCKFAIGYECFHLLIEQ